MSFYVGLVTNCLHDCASVAFPFSPVGPARWNNWLRLDSHEVEVRVGTRGINFLTVDMPTLGKAVLRALETGRFVRPPAFGPASADCELPAFLQGILSTLFLSDGSLSPGLSSTKSNLLRSLLQLCFMCYKLEFPCSPEQESRVVSSFVDTEREISTSLYAHEIYDTRLLRRARCLVHSVFHGFDPRNIQPKHGPGSVATGERGNGKFVFGRLYSSLNRCYPWYEYFEPVLLSRRTLHRVRRFRSLERRTSGCAKVILVPKDSRGPRLISAEPLEYQWIQQGLGSAMVRRLESHPLTRGFVNFEHQSINQALALESSKTGSMATLDLKDASDRVKLSLVEELFPQELFRHLSAARSDQTLLPIGSDGKVQNLSKYAPMGSALCFPVLAIVVWALSKSAVETQTGSSTDVFVYGDDLIVPRLSATKVMDTLQAYGLKVNVDKSYIQGKYRESCGMDAFDGECVTFLKPKTLWTCNPKDASAYAGWISLVNDLDSELFPRTRSYLVDKIQGTFGSVPYGTTDSPFPCWEVSSRREAQSLNELGGFKHRWDSDLQLVTVKVRSLRVRTSSSAIAGYDRLLKDFSMSNPTKGRRIKRQHWIVPDAWSAQKAAFSVACGDQVVCFRSRFSPY